jgi:hypothetical protein
MPAIAEMIAGMARSYVRKDDQGQRAQAQAAGSGNSCAIIDQQ